MLSAYALACAAVLLATISPASAGLQTSDERIVLQTTFGDLELALYTEVYHTAPLVQSGVVKRKPCDHPGMSMHHHRLPPSPPNTS